MRILLFIPALNSGGAERVMVTISNYLSKRGHTVEILTLNYDYSFYQIDDSVIVRGMNLSIKNKGIKRKFEILYKELYRRHKFIKEVNDFRPDVVLSFLNTTNFIALSSIKRIHCPLIVSERNDPLSYSKIAQFLCRKLYPKARTIVCQGTKVADYYRKIGAKCVVIANPLNTSAIGEFIENGNNKLVTVGRLEEAKNQELLIKAFAEVVKKHPNYVLEIYGEGNLENELKLLISRLGLSEKVFLCGTRKNVMATVSDYNCFILSSNYEGFPNVLLEAMASGLPVVSTNFSTGVAEELIIDDINGYLVPINDVHKLSEAIEKIIVDNDKNKRMRKENIKIRELFSEEVVCEKWERLLLENCTRGKNDRED